MLVKIIEKSNEKDYEISDLIEHLKNNVNIDRCGAIFSFEGFVRANEENKTVERMELTTPNIEKTENELKELVTNALKKYKIEEIAVVHYVGNFYIGDPLFLVAVMGHHRGDTLKALSEVIEKTKFELEFKKEEISNQGTKTILAGG